MNQGSMDLKVHRPWVHVGEQFVFWTLKSLKDFAFMNWKVNPERSNCFHRNLVIQLYLANQDCPLSGRIYYPCYLHVQYTSVSLSVTDVTCMWAKLTISQGFFWRCSLAKRFINSKEVFVGHFLEYFSIFHWRPYFRFFTVLCPNRSPLTKKQKNSTKKLKNNIAWGWF